MILAILRHTPVWVWALLGTLIVFGLSQTRPQTIGRARAILLPLVMVLFSLNGALSTFTQMPVALVGWLAGYWLALGIAGAAVAVQGASWLQASRQFRVPGSWVPLLLIVSLFVTKYSVGVYLRINPSLATGTGLTAILSLTYGIFAGVFSGRAWSLLRLARGSRAVQTAQTV